MRSHLKHHGQIQWLRRQLLRWGRANFREFPWRHDRDPYRLLITEVLLKQTGARQILAVREHILQKYGCPEHLAAADLRQLKATVHPLGLGSQRSRHLVELGKALALKGKVPRTRRHLQQLPGVGPYSANAVACFAYGHRCAAVDVNVARVVARFFGIQVIRGELRKNELVLRRAANLVDGSNPRHLNWALLDLGALVCRPAPRCSICPLKSQCEYATTRNLAAGRQAVRTG